MKVEKQLPFRFRFFRQVYGRYAKPRSRARRLGAQWLRQMALGNGPRLELANRDRDFKFKILVSLYALSLVGFLVYSLNTNLFSWALPILTSIAAIVLAWATVVQSQQFPLREEFVSTRVASIPISYVHMEEKVLVTIMNRGASAIIGEIGLGVGWFERGLRVRVFLLGYERVSWGYALLNTGDIIRMSEQALSKAFERIIQKMDNEQLRVADEFEAELVVLVIDPSRGEGIFPGMQRVSGLISACSLGIEFADAYYALKNKKPLWVQEVIIEIDKKPTMKVSGLEMAPMTMEFRVPPIQPSVTEIMLEILNRLDKLLEKKA